MTIDVIDIALHTSSFPATYTGPGTLIGNCISSNDSDEVQGWFTADGNQVNIPLGFRPMVISIFDETGVVKWEWKYGMTNIFKTVAAGTLTDDANGYLTVTQDDGSNGNYLVSIAAGIAVSGHKILFEIDG